MSEYAGLLSLITVGIYLLACIVFFYEYQRDKGKYYLWLSLAFLFLLVAKTGEIVLPDNSLILAPFSLLGLACAIYAIWVVWKVRK
jgi:hypothetical protein